MKKLSQFLCGFILLVFSLTGCAVEPQEIPFGQANCTHCSMTVADNRYAAELVNDKGKAFFFDSAECLMAYVHEQPEQGEIAAYLMVSDFTKPGELTDARSASFLQTEALPSPMGFYMNAVADKVAAIKMQQEYGGRLLTWKEAVTAVENNERFE